ncbi:dTDP-4-dehydrorhamnose reductase [Acinetobacter pollinis]|uniref:dTDP-4-dehydrorhamnose reductase n=1 Tax=Acinetobacter pollinis TaxID=2605270 RepID=UPI0018A27067|nr:dTDP-4-dehydrorhamnose reductase [Acinetobacter pollinis]MBF7690076.1 dTDP-4-dehydrorhamnose reductase [Acinetobacter pollinis]MBF7698627.1 dTDP-4-dehydrorhamnose reductase [Acinetobacter pollinis]
MKILLLGKNGQVGWELQRALQPLGEVYALDRNTCPTLNLTGDITNHQGLQKIFDQIKPDVVVNATAYTAVDKAETEQENADLINHQSVQVLADLACQYNALLIHYSTDYVFAGTGKKAWLETDTTSPNNVYGVTKRAGEVALESSKAKFLNFRTSWVYGTHGHNFIKTMLKLAQSKDELSIIHDQIGAPTSASLIADVTAHAIRYYFANTDKQDSLHGHYHLAPQGETSWFDYANFIFSIAREKGLELKVKQVHKVATSDYPTPAQRPLNSRLNTEKIRTNFKIHLPNWQQGVAHALGEII